MRKTFLLRITCWSSPFYKAWLRLHNILLREETTDHLQSLSVLLQGDWGPWCLAVQLCGSWMRISVANDSQVAGTVVRTRRWWRGGKETVMGIPQGACSSACLFFPSVQRAPLALWVPCPWRAFCFLSAALIHPWRKMCGFHKAVPLKSALQGVPASRHCIFTCI